MDHEEFNRQYLNEPTFETDYGRVTHVCSVCRHEIEVMLPKPNKTGTAFRKCWFCDSIETIKAGPTDDFN